MACTPSHHSTDVGRGEGGTPRGVVSAARDTWAPPPLPAALRGISYCGSAYLVQTERQNRMLGSCAGILPSHLPAPLVLTVGDVFYVRIAHEMTGELDFPVPESTGSAVVRAQRRGHIVQYRAQSSGSATLIARRTIFCEGIDPNEGSCPVLAVVVARG